MLRSIRAEWYKAVRRPYFPHPVFDLHPAHCGGRVLPVPHQDQSPGITPIGLPSP